MVFSVIEDNVLANGEGVLIRRTQDSIVYSDGKNTITLAMEPGVTETGKYDDLAIVYWPLKYPTPDFPTDKIVADIKEALCVLNTDVVFSLVAQ
jgi:hypothetical protein